MSIQSAIEAKPIKNWDLLRENLIKAIKTQYAQFPECEEMTDPLTKVSDKCEDIHLEVNQSLYSFDSPPFTIQRVAELAQDGKKYYSTLPKYLRALQHTLNVSSTVNDFDDDNLLKLVQEPVERDVMLEQIPWVEEK